MTDFAAKVAGGRVLYVPHSHVIHKQAPIGRCVVIVTGDGDVCGTPFFHEGERRAHVPECSRRHASAIHAFRKRQHPEIMAPWDPEIAEWMAAHKDAVLAGRLKV